MSARQFGRSSFKPSHLGVGVGASRGEDEENVLNETGEDDGDESSSAKAASSAAFMNLAGAAKEPAETMSTQTSPEDEGVDFGNRPASQEDPEDPEDSSVNADELDKLLDDSDEENVADGEVSTTLNKADKADNGQTGVATQDEVNLNDIDTSDSDDDNMRDLSQATEATNTQQTGDLFGDSDSEDELPVLSATQTKDYGSQPQPRVSQETAAEMFPESEDDEDDEAKSSTDVDPSSTTEPQNSLMSAGGADLDDDSVEMEVAASQGVTEYDGGDESDHDATGERKSKKKDKKGKKKLSKNKSRSDDDGGDDEDLIDDEQPQSTKPTSVETEIDAIRAVDAGPSAEDLERDRMFKVDQEEIDRKLDIINGQVMAMMQKKLLGADEQRDQLQEMRVWFKRIRESSNEELMDFVRDEMLSSLRAVRGGDGERYLASLEQFLARAEDAEDSDFDFDATEFDDDDEEERVEGGRSMAEEPEVIEFSDSDDGDEGEPADDPVKMKHEELAVAAKAVPKTTDVSELELPLGEDLTEGDGVIALPDAIQKQDVPPFAQQSQQSIEVHAVHRVTPDVKQQPSISLRKQQIKKRFLMASRNVKFASERFAAKAQKPDLKRELKREQRAKIESNALRSYSRIYCRRIDLDSQKEIASKCRALSDLFFQRVERKVAVKKLREHARREKLRREYLRSANDDEVELDDGEMDEDGRFAAIELTEEEQQAHEMAFIEEAMAADEAAEMEEEGAEEDEEDEGDEGEDLAGLMEGQDEGENNQELASERSLQSTNVSDVDNLDSAPTAAQSSWVGTEIDDDGGATQSQIQRQTETQTQLQTDVVSEPVAKEGEDDTVENSDDEDEEEEVHRRPPTKEEQKRAEMIKQARKQGKSLYELQVMEEERRARAEKRGGLFDTEAEEEEETGMQAGLEDFGFGTSKQREGDEERDALKMRADDFRGIADDLSDDEKENRDEDAAARFRAKQAELDDMIAAKKIIKGDLGKKNKGRGALSEQFLAGAEMENQLDPDADVEEQIAELDKKLKEFSEEELLAQIQEEKRAKMAQMAVLAEDSDSNGETDSDDNDDDPDEAFMTNEQKDAHRAEKARQKEQKQKQRIQQAEFKALARQRRFFRQESTRKARVEELRLRRVGSQGGYDTQGVSHAQSQNVLNGSSGSFDASTSINAHTIKHSASTTLHRQPSLQRVHSSGALPSQPLKQRSVSQGQTSGVDLTRQPSLVRKPSLVRSRSHVGEKTTLVRQQSLAGVTGELGGLGSDKLTFKRQRSQLAARNNSVKGPGAATHASNLSASHAFLFRNAGAIPGAADASSASSSSGAGAGGNGLKRKGSLYSSINRN